MCAKSGAEPSRYAHACHARRRARVRREVFRGTEVAGAHRSGSEGAVAAVLGFAVAAYAAYFCAPGFASGALLGARARAVGPTACSQTCQLSAQSRVFDASCSMQFQIIECSSAQAPSGLCWSPGQACKSGSCLQLV